MSRRKKSELELLRTLSVAEDDVANGRVAPMQNTFDDIRKALLERKSDGIFIINALDALGYTAEANEEDKKQCYCLLRCI